MRKKAIYLLPDEMKDCLVHCGFCKKQDLAQNFEKGKIDSYFKCPNCRRFIRRLYESKDDI